MNDLITVTLRLLDGDREGPITAQIEGSESRAVSFARTDWYKAIGHEVLGDLLAQPGVYVLVGRSSDSVRPRVYIGQADRLSSRLNSHLSSPAKSWWERACVFTGGLNPTSIDWLEAELIADARRAGRSVVENGASPRRPHLSWGEQQSMTQLANRARLLLIELGVDALGPVLPLGAGRAVEAPRHDRLPAPTGRNVYIVVGESESNWRRWEDWIDYGLVTGGGSLRIGRGMDKIKRGDRIFAYLSGRGYVGVGVALADAAPIDRVETSDTSGHVRPVIEMPFAIGRASEMHLGDPIRAERAARVVWLKPASRDRGFYERDIFHSPMTTCTLHDKRTAERVLSHFGLSESIGETPG